MTEQIRHKKKSGRPLSFDPNLALDEMMKVFWRQGYQATSVDDLARCIGVTKPSIYGSFGDKQQIFLKSLRHYLDKAPLGEARFQDDCGPLKENLQRLIELSACGGEAGRESGCMLVNATTECMQLGSPFSERIQAGHELTIERIKRLLAKAQTRGELSAGSDINSLARYLNLLTVGAAVMNKAGADYRELQAAIEVGLQVLDGNLTR